MRVVRTERKPIWQTAVLIISSLLSASLVITILIGGIAAAIGGPDVASMGREILVVAGGIIGGIIALVLVGSSVSRFVSNKRAER